MRKCGKNYESMPKVEKVCQTLRSMRDFDKSRESVLNVEKVCPMLPKC